MVGVVGGMLFPAAPAVWPPLTITQTALHSLGVASSVTRYNCWERSPFGYVACAGAKAPVPAEGWPREGEREREREKERGREKAREPLPSSSLPLHWTVLARAPASPLRAGAEKSGTLSAVQMTHPHQHLPPLCVLFFFAQSAMN